MKGKKLIKKTVVVTMATVLTLVVSTASTFADVKELQPIIRFEETANVKSSNLVWHYKKQNGKKYRRLYDTSNKKWLTDWILCK